MPISALVLTLLAIPLSYVNPRMGRSFNLIAAALLYMLYSNCLNIVQSFIAQGKLGFWAGLALPHVDRARGGAAALRAAARAVRALFGRAAAQRSGGMKTLTRYIGREVLAAILLIFGALVMLFAFFDLIHELGDVGRGGYTLRTALALRRAAAAVAHVRALPGRGADRNAVRDGAARRELRVHGDARVRRFAAAGDLGAGPRRHSARARDVPRRRIRRAARRAALRSRSARRRAGDSARIVAQQFQSGFWFKQDLTFVNIRSVLADMTLVGVRIYEFDSDLRLKTLRTAETGSFSGNGQWQLTNVSTTRAHADESRDARRLPTPGLGTRCCGRRS